MLCSDLTFGSTLLFTGNEASKLRKGQLVQGVVILIDKKRGTVGLKASPVLVASNVVPDYTMTNI